MDVSPPLPTRLVIACDVADAFGQLNSNVKSHCDTSPTVNIAISPHTTINPLNTQRKLLYLKTQFVAQ